MDAGPCTLRLLGLFGFRVQEVWALGAKVWDTLRVREPSGTVYPEGPSTK